MRELTPDYLDRHWNAACFGTLPRTLPGDRALLSIIPIAASIQNSGVLHGLETFGPEVRESISSFRWFGLAEYAELLESAVAQSVLVDDLDLERRKRLFEEFSDERDAELDRLYYALDPEADRLFKTFAERIRKEPTAFARLDDHERSRELGPRRIAMASALKG